MFPFENIDVAQSFTQTNPKSAEAYIYIYIYIKWLWIDLMAKCAFERPLPELQSMIWVLGLPFKADMYAKQSS